MAFDDAVCLEDLTKGLLDSDRTDSLAGLTNKSFAVAVESVEAVETSGERVALARF